MREFILRCLRAAAILLVFAFGLPSVFVAIGFAQHLSEGAIPTSAEMLGHVRYVAIAGTSILAVSAIVLLFSLYVWRAADDDRLPSAVVEDRRERVSSGANISPPLDYRVRLAKFVGVEPAALNEIREPFRSKMKFWTSVVDFMRSEPKPPGLIRHFLKRIQLALHGELPNKPGRPRKTFS
jgi:hypothetical protein